MGEINKLMAVLQNCISYGTLLSYSTHELEE